MKKTNYLFLFLLCICSLKNVNAQVDPHFSQYYVYPQWLNPALTGVMDGDYRVAGVYRSQWQNFNGGFSTIGIAAEYATQKDFNIGFGMFQQTAANGGYKYLTPYASAAYTGIKFGKNGTHRVSVGINAGVINRRFDRSKFTFGDQWNPVSGFSVANPTGDVIQTPQSTVFDMGAGALYFDGTPNKKANIYFGFSVAHLTQPLDPFTDGPSKQKMPSRYTFHGGVKIQMSETVSLTPNFLYLMQGQARETMFGAYAQIRGNDVFDFLCGANYRINDAFVPFVGFNHKDFVLGFSYDANISDLGRAVNGVNSFEISLSFTGRKKKNYDTQNFICPRL
ncbi:MAG: PorP/SprF family type IX secretion system membrane protein [Chitinophagaceae bacterium]|jgi:type IX secretion system PorP/SprF family membrane protein